MGGEGGGEFSPSLLGSSLFIIMQKQKLLTGLLLALVFVLGGWWSSRPCVYVQGESENIAVVPAYAGMPFHIRFIHSVQKTPVEEFLVVNQDLTQLDLESTRYHSFGVGLPFTEADGQFHQEDNDFVMDHMDRHFEQLSLRTGLGTQLTVTLDGNVYPLYERFEPGYRIDIYIAPRWLQLRHWLQEGLSWVKSK